MTGMIKKLWQQKGGFLASSSQVLIWIIASQLLMFACMPVISRLYVPAVFGVYAVFTSITSILNQVACLRGEYLINLPKQSSEAEKNLAASLVLTLIFGVFLTITFCFFADSLTGALKITELKSYFWILPVSIMVVGFRNTLQYWAIRQDQYSDAGLANFIQSPVVLVIQIGFGLLYPNALFLVIGAFVGWLVSCLYLIIKITNRALIRSLLINAKGCFSVISDNRRFLAHASLSTLLLNMANYLPVALVAFAYNSQITAWFALAMQAVYSPLDMICVSISQVYLNKGARIWNEAPSELVGFYKNLVKWLLLIGLLPVGLIAFWGGSIFAFVFGSVWHTAGSYAQILSVMFLFRFAIVSASQNLVILKKQGVALLWSLALIGLLCLSFLPACLFESKPTPEFTLGLFSINMIFAYLCLYGLNIKYAKNLAKGLQNSEHPSQNTSENAFSRTPSA